MPYGVSQEQADLWERLNKNPMIKPTLTGSYRYDDTGNKVYDSGDIVSAMGDQLISPGNQAKATFQKIQNDPTMLRRLFGEEEEKAGPAKVKRDSSAPDNRATNLGKQLLLPGTLKKQVDKYKYQMLEDPSQANAATDIILEDSTGPNTPGTNRVASRRMINPEFQQQEDQQKQQQAMMLEQLMSRGGSFDPGSGKMSIQRPAAQPQSSSSSKPMMDAAKMLFESQMKTMPDVPQTIGDGAEQSPNPEYYRPRRIAQNQFMQQLQGLVGGGGASPAMPNAQQPNVSMSEPPPQGVRPNRDAWIVEYMKRRNVPREVAAITYTSNFGQ